MIGLLTLDGGPPPIVTIPNICVLAYLNIYKVAYLEPYILTFLHTCILVWSHTENIPLDVVLNTIQNIYKISLLVPKISVTEHIKKKDKVTLYSHFRSIL